MTKPNTTFASILATLTSLCKEAGIDTRIKPGPKPQYQDSLVLRLLILKSLFGFNSERSFLRYIQNYHRKFFRKIPERSWFNRKAKQLMHHQKTMHELLLLKLGTQQVKIRIADTTGIPVVSLCRAYRCTSFEKKVEVNFGYCAAKELYYYGEKLTLLLTPQGIPTSSFLTPANVHDLKALKQNLRYVSDELTHRYLVADKGYHDGDLETTLRVELGARLVVPDKKRHQHKNTPRDRKMLKKRKIIETVFSQLEEHMRIHQTKAKSQAGLRIRVQSILLGFTFGIYMNQLCGRELLAIKSLLV